MMTLPLKATEWKYWRHRVSIKHYYYYYYYYFALSIILIGNLIDKGPIFSLRKREILSGKVSLVKVGMTRWSQEVRIHMLMSRAQFSLKCFPGTINSK